MNPVTKLDPTAVEAMRKAGSAYREALPAIPTLPKLTISDEVAEKIAAMTPEARETVERYIQAANDKLAANALASLRRTGLVVNRVTVDQASGEIEINPIDQAIYYGHPSMPNMVGLNPFLHLDLSPGETMPWLHGDWRGRDVPPPPHPDARPLNRRQRRQVMHEMRKDRP